MADPERWPRIRAFGFGAVMVACLVAGIVLEFVAPENNPAHRTLMVGVIFSGGLSLGEVRWIFGYRAGFGERTEEHRGD